MPQPYAHELRTAANETTSPIGSVLCTRPIPNAAVTTSLVTVTVNVANSASEIDHTTAEIHKGTDRLFRTNTGTRAAATTTSGTIVGHAIWVRRYRTSPVTPPRPARGDGAGR